MYKLSFSAVAVFAFVALTNAFTFHDNQCGKALVQKGGIIGLVECNYQDKAASHIKVLGDELQVWAFTNDFPVTKIDTRAFPRTEIALTNIYKRNDKAEFSGEVFIPSTTEFPFSFFQIKNDGAQRKTDNSAMLNFQNGAIRWNAGGQILENHV